MAGYIFKVSLNGLKRSDNNQDKPNLFISDTVRRAGVRSNVFYTNYILPYIELLFMKLSPTLSLSPS